ncbi:ABC transporter ATP-binding protein [Paraburkholderia aromaticivorans]|uniref:ABC transporter ATP-binding protein n=1 Tax=Paraburkholderia aromaticivorans TaxID=2026199 RepID=UPI003D67393F
MNQITQPMTTDISIENLYKSYRLDAVQVVGLADVNLRVSADALTVLTGPSGSGKTTLLNMIGCIDRPDSGRIVIDGLDTGALSDDELSDFRAGRIGYVFQNFNLLPVLSAYENVEYPLMMASKPARERARRVGELLDAVGLAAKARHRPGQLSGGERQRVAIARALAADPALVLADEPTANLDSSTGESIIELMRSMQWQRHVSFLVSSHDPQLRAAADAIVEMRDGRIVGQHVMRGVAA